MNVRALLNKYGFQAKKSWGQNFLIDERVYQAIVAATVRSADDWVVEIGAGLGTLTERLATAAANGRVIAVERERDMITVLQGELSGRANLEIVEGNALTIDYEALAARAGKPLAVVGNLPYQIASPLLFNILNARQHVARAVIMLQKEMADRLVAAPGTREYGALGVMIALHADVRTVAKAKSGAFLPAPKVDSAVVEVTPRTPRATVADVAYSQVVHAAFGQRRKTLRNSLRSLRQTEEVDAALVTTGIDGQRRGETLSVEEFAALANAFPTTPPNA